MQYTLKKDKRARRVGLRISPSDGLVVTVPPGFNPRSIPGILESKKSWINEHSHILRQRQNGARGMLPERIEFAATGDVWPVLYRPTTSESVNISEDRQGRLIVYGKTRDAKKCIAALQDWLREKAHDVLIPWLQETCDEIGLVCDDVIIRNQKTRWASCSGKKSISLNMKLLFVEPELLRYVFIHELCHTRHMNHSRTFWKLVEQYEPSWERMDAMLGRAWFKGIPAWVDFKNL